MMCLFKIAAKYRKKLANKNDYLYHVTFAKNIESISNSGLSPFHSGGLGIGAYKERSQNKLFLCEFGAVSFWYSKLTDRAFENCDPQNYIDEGYVPVVLRVLENPEEEYEEDKTGNKDSKHLDNAEAYQIGNSIQPEEIEIWNGNSWKDINNTNSLNLSLALDEHLEFLSNKYNKLFPYELL